MTDLIPLLRRPPTEDVFTPPANAAAFFERYPGEVRSILIMSGHDRVVSVGQTEWMLRAAIKPNDIFTLTKRVELEIQYGDWLQSYPRHAKPDATEQDFLVALRNMIMQVVQQMRAH